MIEETSTAAPESPRETHGLLVGYLLWGFGFLGAHRFYYGRRITGTIWMFTLGLLGIGWIVDLFLMPSLARSAGRKYYDGPYRYDYAWLLLTYGGIFGLHRFYLGKLWTAILYACTAGLGGVGIVYDYWTLNEQTSLANRDWRAGS
jgi:TM2 domain-containing membrane protein YozV